MRGHDANPFGKKINDSQISPGRKFVKHFEYNIDRKALYIIFHLFFRYKTVTLHHIYFLTELFGI